MKAVPPILFLVFNRADTTERVFESIRSVRPRKLYVAADGPRVDRPGEVQCCEKVRELATQVDWQCEVMTLFRDQNLGCKEAVSSAVSWFFEHEAEGIILEDDCLPDRGFYDYCAEMLDLYRNDPRVAMVTGNNFQRGRKRGEGAYYFSKYTHIWGWACWRRSWRLYQSELEFWPEWKQSQEWNSLFGGWMESTYWKIIFSRVYAGGYDSWAYPWMASVWHHKGITVTPNVNLVENIGFGPSATHTSDFDSALRIPSESLGPLVHPQDVCTNRDADDFVFNSVYRESVGSLIRRLPNLFAKKLRQLRGPKS